MPKTPLSFYLHMIAVAVIVVALSNFFLSSRTGALDNAARVGVAAGGEHKESVYDRVMRTGTIRCGYYLFPPIMMQDPNTSELRGFAQDLLQQLGKNLSLKIEWTEKVDFPTMWQGLQAGRYDAICTPVWPMAASARVALFTSPMFYAAVYPWVRSDDKRFDNNFSALNNPSTHVVTQDGNALTVVASRVMPQAQNFAMSPNVPYSDAPMIVGSGKADVMLWDANGVHDYLRANPGSLRRVEGIGPLQTFAFTIAFPSGEHDLTALFNTAILEMINNGHIDQFLTQWEISPGDFLRTAKPYQTPTAN